MVEIRFLLLRPPEPLTPVYVAEGREWAFPPGTSREQAEQTICAALGIDYAAYRWHQHGLTVSQADTLISALATEFASSADAELTDQEIADYFNAATQRGLVPLWELSIHLIESGLWLALESSTSLGARSAIAYLTLPHVTTIDMDRPSVVGMFTLLVNDEVLTQAQVDAIRAMADNRVSRREQLGLPIITAAAVADARAPA